MHGIRRAPVALGAALLAAAALAACTGGGGGGGEDNQDDRKEPAGNEERSQAALERAWVETAHGDLPASMGLWLSDDRMVMLGDAGLSGYDTTTGERLWTLQAPEDTDGICRISAQPNQAGIGGVSLSVGGDCFGVGAFDADDGELLWWHDISDEDSLAGSYPVPSVGESVLTYHLGCGGVYRFSLQDGERLPTMQSRDVRCAHEAVHDGELVAIRNEPADPEDSDTPVEGWIPGSPGTATFAVFDAESGEELWRREVERQGSELHRIIATEPLTLETTEDDSHFIRTFDEGGEEVRRVGPELSGDSSLFTEASLGLTYWVTDGVLVTGYANDPKLYAYDLTTGEELWTAPKSRTDVIGARDGVLLASDPDSAEGLGNLERRLFALDVRSGERTDLGVIPMLHEFDADGAGPQDSRVLPLAWDDRQVYVLYNVVGGGNRIAAYQMPDGGPLS